MAISVTGQEYSYASGGPARSESFTAPAGTTAIILALSQLDNDFTSWAPTYDGVAMTFLKSAFNIIPGERGVALFIIEGAGLAGTKTVTINFYTGVVYVWALAGGSITVEDTAGVGGNGQAKVTFDSGSEPTMAFVATATNAASTEPLSGTTEDYDDGDYRFGHETDLTTGSRNIGWNTSGYDWATAGVLVSEGTVQIAGGHVGMGLGVHGGALTYEGLLRLPYRRVRGLLLGLRHGVISFTAKRQVALVGEGLETPEMTVGGTEGQVLTQHTGSPPTWEDAAAGAAALDDLTDVDAPAPDDGDVLTWDDYLSEWVAAAPAGGALALDDLTDVNAPSPSDNDVLGWDDGAGEWVPVAPGTPDLSSGALDDLGDVNAPSPSDGDVLTWNAGDWVAAAVPASTLAVTATVRSGTVTVPASYSHVAVPFTSETRDDGGWWAVGTPTRFTVDRDGLYLVSLRAPWYNTAQGERITGYKLNGAAGVRVTWHLATSSYYQYSHFAIPLVLSAGDYIELYAESSHATALLSGAIGTVALLGEVA